MKRLSPSMLGLVFAAAVLAPGLSAQSQAASTGTGSKMQLGPQVGFATNDFDAFIGGQFSYQVAKRCDIYPALTIYFPGNNITAWSVHAMARYWPKLDMKNPGLYVGGGLNWAHASASGVSNSELGLELLGGWQFTTKSSVRPFGELRIVAGGDADRVEFGGGINFKL